MKACNKMERWMWQGTVFLATPSTPPPLPVAVRWLTASGGVTRRRYENTRLGARRRGKKNNKRATLGREPNEGVPCSLWWIISVVLELLFILYRSENREPDVWDRKKINMKRRRRRGELRKRRRDCSLTSRYQTAYCSSFRGSFYPPASERWRCFWCQTL